MPAHDPRLYNEALAPVPRGSACGKTYPPAAGGWVDFGEHKGSILERAEGSGDKWLLKH